MQPGTMIGSNVGFGMKWLSLPPVEQQRALALLHHLDAARAELPVEVTGAGVEGLVVVVVGVDGAERQVHGRPRIRVVTAVSARVSWPKA